MSARRARHTRPSRLIPLTLLVAFLFFALLADLLGRYISPGWAWFAVAAGLAGAAWGVGVWMERGRP